MSLTTLPTATTPILEPSDLPAAGRAASSLPFFPTSIA